MGTGVDPSQKIVAIVINQTQPCDFEVGQMIVSQSSNIKLKIYRNFQNYEEEEEEGWGSSSARAVKILLGLLESRSCNAANFLSLHC